MVSKFGALNQVMAGQVNTDINISGSSRALSHYDPRVIQDLTGMSAYKNGMNASQIDLELTILKCLLGTQHQAQAHHSKSGFIQL